MTKILIVDDSSINLITLSEILEKLIPYCQVIVSDNGIEGIEKARAESPDTIILDIRMPEMDGFEVCRILKEDVNTKHIPIILLTGYRTDTEHRVKGLEIGADAFLSKPIDMIELGAQVKAMLRIKKAEDLLREERNLLEEKVKERTKALDYSEKRYKVIFENTSDAIFIHEIDGGKFLEVNKAACERLGYSREELLDMTPECIDSPEYSKVAINRAQELLQKGYMTFETIHITKEGKEIPVELNSKIIEFDDREVIISVARDITERKKIEAARQQFSMELEVQVKERTCELEAKNEALKIEISERKKAEEERLKLEKQLRQAQKMEAIGTLAGGIAHDFNNILGAILGYTELVIDDVPKGSMARRNMEQILKASHRAVELVKQILAFSRQQEMERKPVEIDLIIKEALKLLRSSLPSTINIKHNIKAKEACVLGDATQIHQILMNLCTNAFHAMRDTGGTLEVILDELNIEMDSIEINQGEYIRLIVNDTGHGMSDDIKERIFEPYFTTKNLSEGTGLGLAVVHGIVRSYGGEIKFHSEAGKGSSFTVIFPKYKGNKFKMEEYDKDIPKGKGRILFVDDEESLAELMEQMLGRLGYMPVIMTSSTEALDVFRKEPNNFDLIITDQTMPEMTGSNLAKEILKIRPEIPVILCTGFTDIISPDEVKSIGIREFILKPLNKKNIAEILSKLIKVNGE